MTKDEAINWIINISADIGKVEHRDLWHYEQALSEIREMLETAQPEPQWIPCSERFPESGRYLVSCSLSVFSPQVLNYDENNGEWFYDGCKSMDVEIPTINAWMPLPEPYRKEGD